MNNQKYDGITITLKGSVINGITIQEHDRVELIPTPLKKQRFQKTDKQ
tara:strand:- start:440 stop:583 length:144 start_codon:yes stop_codon:yes gene_type:complete